MSSYSSLSKSTGFSLIEVMIALVVLSLGLLGMALLQTSALRSGQAANYRSQATILAYDLADMIRANRLQAAGYDLIGADSFTAANAVNGRGGICLPAPVGAPTVRWQIDRNAWTCAAARALPGVSGDVVVTPATGGAAGVVAVTLTWVNDRSVDVDPDATPDPSQPRQGRVVVTTGI